MSERDIAGLLFVAEMYGVQLDQLAVQLGGQRVAGAGFALRWRGQGYADSARLGPGRPWIWLTRAGLLACAACRTGRPRPRWPGSPISAR